MDVAFEVTGNAAAARLVTDVVRVWGTVSIVAIHAEPVPVNLYQMFARELHMHGSRLYTRADWEEAVCASLPVFNSASYCFLDVCVLVPFAE